MKLVAYSLLLTIAFAAGCQQNTTTAVAPPTPETVSVTDPEVTPEEPAEEAPKEFVIDVRSQEEWDTGHLSQAILIPHTDIAERISEVTEDKSAKLVLY